MAFNYKKYTNSEQHGTKYPWIKDMFGNPYDCNLYESKPEDVLEVMGKESKTTFVVVYSERSNSIIFQVDNHDGLAPRLFVLDLNNTAVAHMVAYGMKKLSEYYITRMLEAEFVCRVDEI